MAAIGMNEDKWYFTKEQLENTPSRRAGIPADKELSYRQQAATLIQDMGQRLSVYPSFVFDQFNLSLEIAVLFYTDGSESLCVYFSPLLKQPCYVSIIYSTLKYSLVILNDELFSSQLTINTSIVYMHRFYMFYPFTRFHRHVRIMFDHTYKKVIVH